jgi:4'-phosphopantetheinyl transferase
VVALAPVPAGAASRAAWERAYLWPAEQALLGDRAAEKRRAEFVAGRLAAKSAAALLLGPRWDRGDIAVLREGGESTGPPRLALSGGWPCAVRASISHADGVAVAAASGEAVGVDLVAIEHQGPAFEAEAFAPGELDAWRGWLGAEAARHDAVAIAFGAKEAALKWTGTGLTVPLHDVAVLPLQGEARPLSGGAGWGRVLEVDAGGGGALVTVQQTSLRVSLERKRERTRSILPAQVLLLGKRVVVLLWGPGPPPVHG